MSENETSVAIKMQDLSPEYAEIMVLGNVLQKSGYFKDVQDQAQAVTKILFGRELGFSPIVSMGGIHIIEGKPALSSNLMATLIKRSGKYDYRVKRWTVTECVITFKEKVDGKWEDVGDASFTMDDARTAQVKFEGARGPSGWKKFPKAMLFARALSQGLRAYCPDVSAAPVYVPEEMGADVNEDGDVVSVPAPRNVTPPEAKRTTEPVPVKRPAKKEAPVPTVPPASGLNSNINDHRYDEPVEPPPYDDVPPPEDEAILPPESDRIETKDAQYLHKRFREALRPDIQREAEKLLHDWLGTGLYLNEYGNPSAKAIRKVDFKAVGNAAVEYAKAL